MKNYPAPWGKLLIGVSAFASLICAGASIAILLNAGNGPEAPWVMLTAGMLPLFILVVAALFTVRGYVLTADEILVQRSFWSTRFERARLQSASVDPTALRNSIRLFGNGGLFSFTGVFRSPALGRYRAYVTDPARCVVLRFADRVVVFSPADPEAFVRDLSARR